MDFSFVIFLCKRCLLGQTKRKGTLLTIFRPPRISPPRAFYIVHKFQTPLLIRNPFIRHLRVSTRENSYLSNQWLDVNVIAARSAMTNLDISFRSSFKVKYLLFRRTFNCTLLQLIVGKSALFIVFHIDFSSSSRILLSPYFCSPISFTDKKF